MTILNLLQNVKYNLIEGPANEFNHELCVLNLIDAIELLEKGHPVTAEIERIASKSITIGELRKKIKPAQEN